MSQICIITPYKEITQIARKIEPKISENFMIKEAAIEQTESILKKLKKDEIYAIVTTEGNAEYLRQKGFKVPIVIIEIDPLEIISSINLGKTIYGEPLAFFQYKYSTQFSDQRYTEFIKNVLKINIIRVFYKDKKDALEKLKDVQKKGVKAIISGGIVKNLATTLNLPCIRINITEEALIRAYYHAKDIVSGIKWEQHNILRSKVLLEYSHQGIIIIDLQNNIAQSNHIAENILNINPLQIKNKPVNEVIPDSILCQLFKDNNDNEITSIICSFNGNQVLLYKVPIYQQGQLLENILIFNQATFIKNMEEKIRRSEHEKKLTAKYQFVNIIAKSPKMNDAICIAKKFSRYNETILITGETGTGKELFAQSIHNHSERGTLPFVAVNCASLPPNLLTSELFGYVKGAFTGANKEGKKGLFELSHNGTIFLDEIGDISSELQSGLLRVIEEKEIMRIGDIKVTPVNVRIIAATNKELSKEVEKGHFRRDLYYRLNALEIHIPPLRERKEDIIPLALHFFDTLKINSASLLKNNISFYKDLLMEYDWPGNVRELENFILRLGILLEPNFTSESVCSFINNFFSKKIENSKKEFNLQIELDGDLKETMEDLEKQLIIKEYLRSGRNKNKLADKLGIGRTTLWRKLKETGILKE